MRHLFLLFVMTFFISCNGRAVEATPHSTNSEGTSSPAKSDDEVPTQNNNPNIDIATAKKMMKDNKEIVLIDVRTQREVDMGIIGTPLHIDISQPDFAQKIAALDKEKEYIVYCAVGGRSSRAVSQMQQLGFKKAYNLQGGYNQWIRQ